MSVCAYFPYVNTLPQSETHVSEPPMRLPNRRRRVQCVHRTFTVPIRAYDGVFYGYAAFGVETEMRPASVGIDAGAQIANGSSLSKLTHRNCCLVVNPTGCLRR